MSITHEAHIGEAIELTSASLIDKLYEIPGIEGNATFWNVIVYAGQLAYTGAVSACTW